MSQSTASNPSSHEIAHPVPLGVLFATFGALMALTVITVMATWVDLGMMNIWLALFIAAIKVTLVALYFMHLRWDNRFNAIIFIAALFFVAIFIGITVLDTREYKVNYNPPQSTVAP
ncbi:MAG TPA: cytochrome C oxidase subunit IV family protein [Tepidisphaeraceae bacterium]|nr:cytochrome C oxidase subunit IV family protein [Tepidisphaeraceae bacterium]